ncbi:AAA family ATPase [Blastopirellula marina]|uniref:ABC transport protein, ATP-binding subunit n=1 Tax=Blastopirellula marina DSM 3645 TaxID=314230 RepID=A3ZRZ8_9BACT|nr:AAA family ATPase [Blastopirellula marina]EAQ80920.1 ABC transport protein, ATP-binding subunit [Blastopirellula marina DSM 3645]
MKIVQLDIEGFRSLKSQSWRPGDLNVVIGPNASGKSNLLRALEMLSAAAGERLEKFVLREGGMDSIVFDGSADGIAFKIRLQSPSNPVEQASTSISYLLSLLRIPSLRTFLIGEESLSENRSDDSLGIFRLLQRDPENSIVRNREMKDVEFIETNELSPIESLLPIASGQFSVHPILKKLQKFLAESCVYQSIPTNRNAPLRLAQVTRSDTQVDSDGQNLISVLHTLYSSNRDFEKELDAAMRIAFGDDYDRLVFPPAADQRIQMRIRWKSLKREQSAADLSDGTLRFLFLIAILANPEPPPLIAIDEPETGLHPSMFPVIVDLARQCSTKSQVIFTTHSAEFLSAFGKEAPTTTVAERVNGETQLRVLDKDELDHWLKQYTLGELFRSNELETMQ